jgi:hypothetical protein
MNDDSYEHVKPTYYFKVDSNYILARFCKGFDFKIFNKFSLKKIDTFDEEKIIKKLCPTSYYAGITGTTEAVLYCKYNNNLKKEFFNNSDQLPVEGSIYYDHFYFEPKPYIRKE